MIDRLRSHLKNEKGFTLIELLVVIAIIAILVVIVIVAINPVQRLADATDRTAASNVRASGTLVATCVTTQAATVGGLNNCNSIPNVNANGNGTVASGVGIQTVVVAGNTTVICVDQQGNSGTGGTTAHWYMFSTTTGSVSTYNTATRPTCV